MSRPIFLSAYWRHLALLNYEVDPYLLKPHLPAGTELDFLNGKTYISLVAFLFEQTSLFGKIPAFFHRNFEEVNLRFYVVRKENDQIKRGVVFIKEIVPKPFLAWVARTFYKENYISMPMSHNIEIGNSYNYVWDEHSLFVKTEDKVFTAAPNSPERWITEHYWGYTKINDQKTLEYEVQHPIWNLYKILDYKVDVNIASLYGPQFTETFNQKPTSQFLADGSKVTVHWPKKVPGTFSSP
ncbi:MAG: DUF2071 domain-containing protein [Bdellovibrionales bacterium]|nr:DUF2071 domain-containing protein [Bdellovibrionales bacterium]